MRLVSKPLAEVRYCACRDGIALKSCRNVCQVLEVCRVQCSDVELNTFASAQHIVTHSILHSSKKLAKRTIFNWHVFETLTVDSPLWGTLMEIYHSLEHV